VTPDDRTRVSHQKAAARLLGSPRVAARLERAPTALPGNGPAVSRSALQPEGAAEMGGVTHSRTQADARQSATSVA